MKVQSEKTKSVEQKRIIHIEIDEDEAIALCGDRREMLFLDITLRLRKKIMEDFHIPGKGDILKYGNCKHCGSSVVNSIIGFKCIGCGRFGENDLIE